MFSFDDSDYWFKPLQKRSWFTRFGVGIFNRHELHWYRMVSSNKLGDNTAQSAVLEVVFGGDNSPSLSGRFNDSCLINWLEGRHI